MIFSFTVFSQVEYRIKVESGFLKYNYLTIQIDPGPNSTWKGYNLKGDNGIDINLINGYIFGDKFFTGLGVGYLNFKGINGLSLFADFEYLPLKTRLTPLLDIRLGYSHVWNQYEKGTGTAIFELGGGLNYKLTEKSNIYLQYGYLMTQQSNLTPIRIGFRLKL